MILTIFEFDLSEKKKKIHKIKQFKVTVLKIGNSAIPEYLRTIWLVAYVCLALMLDQALDYVSQSRNSKPACIAECQDSPNYSTMELTYTYINWADSHT